MKGTAELPAPCPPPTTTIGFSGRSNRHKAVVVSLAMDDDDDRMSTVDAFREARLGQRTAMRHRWRKFAPPAKAPRPGLILLDLNMPRKDKREALR